MKPSDIKKIDDVKEVIEDKISDIKEMLEERAIKKAENLANQKTRLRDEKYNELLRDIKENSKSSVLKMIVYGVISTILSPLGQIFLIGLDSDAIKIIVVALLSGFFSSACIVYACASENKSSNKQTLNTTYDSFKFDVIARDNNATNLQDKIAKLEEVIAKQKDELAEVGKLYNEQLIRTQNIESELTNAKFEERLRVEIEKVKLNGKIYNRNQLDNERD